MKYKIVFFDVDGTLTDERDGHIPERTKEAVQKLLHKGFKVVAATGRPLSMCTELKALGIQTFITANGGYATHEQTIIHQVVLDKSIVEEVSLFAAHHFHGILYMTDSLSMNGIQSEQIAHALKETLFLNEYPVLAEKINSEDVYLMCLYADGRMVKSYQEAFPHLNFNRWHPYIVNVLQENVSKSAAIKNVLAHFGYKESEAIAFGDGRNDIDMLKLVGLGIAMGNGSIALKASADIVTKKASENGIDFALRKLGLI